VGATGAALVAMVARICAESPKYAHLAGLVAKLTEQADELRAELSAAGDRDEAAFQAVVAAQALPRATDGERAERTEALQRGLVAAAESPLQTAELALDVLRLAHDALALGNLHLASDIGCAAEFASAAIAAAAYNVRVNHGYMTDAGAIAAQSATLLAYEREANALLVTVRNHFEAGTST
jgi:formiminotetrahydrofolate cyclodeaminase